ncbi:hypothetical protein F4779DRAFT_618766 [Xylariaceae sp. FL0662B]|nr:hypothetical protein F4779DRAFT_618766 [Xylariaceae sp. FL0662B]
MSTLREVGRILSGNRGKTRHFTPEARAFMTGAVLGGQSQTAVAEAFHCKRQTVAQQISRFREQHNFYSRPHQRRRPNLGSRRHAGVVGIPGGGHGAAILRVAPCRADRAQR